MDFVPLTAKGERVSANTLNRMQAEIAARTIMRSGGHLVQQRSGGTVLAKRPTGLLPASRSRGSGSARQCPFDISVNYDAGLGLYFATFRPGTINQLLPSNYLTGVAVPATGTRYIVLSCTASNGKITSAAFAAESTVPDAIEPYAGQPPVAFKILIGIVIDTVATKVLSCGNIQASGVESFRLQKSGPAAGELPYDVYYTWALAII